LIRYSAKHGLLSTVMLLWTLALGGSAPAGAVSSTTAAPQREPIRMWFWGAPPNLQEALQRALVDTGARVTRPAHGLPVGGDLEYADELSSQKRTLYLRLVEGLVKKGVPISGFGLEAHLLPHRPFAQKDYRQFLAELAGMGLTLHVTELDVNDKSFPADMETRDRLGADYCKQFLETALDEKSVKALLTWGMSDRYNWMNKLKAPNRADGLPSRSFPFDADLRPKPLYYVLAAALKSAPIR